MKDVCGLTENDNSFLGFPDKMKKVVVEYFATYQQKKNVQLDSEGLAVAFLSSVFGLCMNYFIVKAISTKIPFEETLELLVDGFSILPKK